MKTLIFIAAMLAAGCASNRPTEAALKAGQDAAGKKLLQCALTAVPSLDDGFSDASTIAMAAASVCNSESTAFSRSFAVAIENEYEQLKLMRTLGSQQNQMQTFLPYVLDYRNGRRPK